LPTLIFAPPLDGASEQLLVLASAIGVARAVRFSMR
jgi:hypothetical protein